MNITLIGAGNLATNVGKALVKSGHSIIQVYSRTMDSAAALAAILQTEPIVDLALLSPAADLYVIAVKDSVLTQVIRQVCTVNPDAVYAHTAGSMPISSFENCASHYGVFYPMQTFSKSREVDFSVIPVFLEASDDYAASVLTDVAGSISGNVSFLSSERRRFLHLAAVFACNFTNHCYALADEVLRRSGVPFEALLPLIDETANKVHEMSPAKAQTGPAVRYDQNVMEAQTRLIADTPLVKELYELISLSIHNMYKSYSLS